MPYIYPGQDPGPRGFIRTLGRVPDYPFNGAGTGGGTMNGRNGGYTKPYRPYVPGGYDIPHFDPVPGTPGSPGAGTPIGQPSTGCGGSSVAEIGCSILFPSCGPEYLACVGAGSLVPGLGPAGPQPGEGAEPGEACPTGYTKVGGTCVANRPGAYLPGGQPATVPTTGTPLGTGWEAVTGSFGLPALTPLPVQRTRYECPAGMVLGKDNLCYPKSTPGLGRRGSFRKWKGSRRPKVSAAEWKQLQRAARTREKVKDVAKEAGWKVSKYGTRRGR